MADQWPSAGRIVHIKADDGGCRSAVIVRVVGPDGPEADIELFVFPSASLDRMGQAGIRFVPFADRAAVHFGEWHWPEYVGPVAER